jgi:hypothetical protein
MGFLMAVGLVAAFPSLAQAAGHFSGWSTPVGLGCGLINSDPNDPPGSGGNDTGPAISKDELSLYFASDVAGPPLRIFVSRRASVHDAWGTPVALGSNVNDGIHTSGVPSLSRDGHWLFFNSNRGFGDIDIWASYREHVHDDFDWQPAVNLGPGVNTSGFDAGASYFENDGGAPQLFFGRADISSHQSTNTKIMVSEQLPDGTFGNAHEVTELNLDRWGSQRPSIRFDGLEIFFFSMRPGSLVGPGGVATSDIWVATRQSLDDVWDVPVNLGAPINTSVADFHPQISGDGLTLYFASSNQDGTCGGYNLFVSTRTRVHG